jgi:hypothetical protein
MSVGQSSQLVINIAQQPPAQWYLDVLYLNHGYHFFAPNPGDGHLIYFDLFDAQGNAIKQGKFPDWDLYRPRLWYHRHFMLAEQVGAGGTDEQWQRRYLEAYARQLLRQFGGESVRVRWIAHRPPSPYGLPRPPKLDEPASYSVRMEVVQRRSDLGPTDDSETQATAEEPDVANRWIGVPR